MTDLDELNKLEGLSIKISDLINQNKFENILELDLQRKKIIGILPKLNSSEAFKKSDVIIDFTVPKCTLEVLNIAAKQKKREIIGTTGFSLKEENIIKKFLDTSVQLIYLIQDLIL